MYSLVWFFLALVTQPIQFLGQVHANALVRIELEYVRTLGWGDVTHASSDLTEREAAYGGGMLSNVSGIAVSESGHVFVLDRDFKKIVEFDSAGDYKGLILGGYGRGPGEFIRPFGLSYWRGELLIGDPQQGRVSVFDVYGEHSTDVHLPFQAFDFHYQNGRIHALGLFDRIRTIDRQGMETEPLGALKPEWVELVEHGSLGALGVGIGAGIVYASPHIGVHLLIDSEGKAREVGAPLWEDIPVGSYDAPVGPPVKFVPVSVLAAGVIRDRYAVTVYRAHHDPRRVGVLSSPPPAGSHWVLVQSLDDGRTLGQIQLDQDRMVGLYEIAEWGGGAYLYASVIEDSGTPAIDVYRIILDSIR